MRFRNRPHYIGIPDATFTPVRALVFVVMLAAACGGTGDESPFVLLVCLDGATPSVIDELRSADRLPSFEKLIRSGIYGPLQSLPARAELPSEGVEIK